MQELTLHTVKDVCEAIQASEAPEADVHIGLFGQMHEDFLVHGEDDEHVRA